jgi:hypothetical protein
VKLLVRVEGEKVANFNIAISSSILTRTLHPGTCFMCFKGILDPENIGVDPKIIGKELEITEL